MSGLIAVVLTLNEGRSVNPGYTRARATLSIVSSSAQRRPERQPRLHVWLGVDGEVPPNALNEGRSINPGYTRGSPPVVARVALRSTKAGASTPATRHRDSRPNARSIPLNEGRSVNPGYTRTATAIVRVVAQRSTKAGASTPATRPVGAQLDFGLQRSTKAGASTPATRWTGLRSGWGARRSTKAGASTPATRDVQRRPRRGCRSSLNEGRSVNPGYTPRFQQRQESAPRRSTKAGASTPATRKARWTGMSMSITAQRRPERQPRLHGQVLSRKAKRSATLNEGRSVNPGYTPCWRSARPRPASLNEGRSVNPGYTGDGVGRGAEAGHRSTKAGASTPATLLNSAKGQYRDKPSLVHGCGSLDNDAFASISRDFGRYPVRMVRIKQSRLP